MHLLHKHFLRLLLLLSLIVLLNGCQALNNTIDSIAEPDVPTAADPENTTDEKPASPRGNKANIKSGDIEHIHIKAPNHTIFAGAEHPVTVELIEVDGTVREADCSEVSLRSHSPEFLSIDIDQNGTCILNVDEFAPIGSVVQLTAEVEQHSYTSSYIILYELGKTIEHVSGEALPVVTNADSIAVIVNKERSLPPDYRPADLVEPDVHFSFSEQHDKRLLREEAAIALEKLFASAEEDQIELVAVSGFRAYNTQRSIYEWNVSNRGEEHAKRFSAYPGTSEHQTGLAMDVSSPSVGNALDQALGDTKEGQWLADNAHRFGFIIRYPKDKEQITGYAYEPWHLRYVGEAIAKDIYERAISLEEFFYDTIETTPVFEQ